MNILTWLLRIILFVILLGLAIKNSNEVELRFFFDASWQAPLSLVVLAAFGSGILLGALALMPKLFSQRRGISRLRKQAEKQTNNAKAEETPVPTDV